MTASSIQLCNNDPLPSWPYTYFLLWDTRAMVCSPGPHCWLSKALKCPYSQVLAVRKIHFWITFFLLLNHYNFVIFKDDSNYRQVFFPWTLLKEVIFFGSLSLFSNQCLSHLPQRTLGFTLLRLEESLFYFLQVCAQALSMRTVSLHLGERPWDTALTSVPVFKW